MSTLQDHPWYDVAGPETAPSIVFVHGLSLNRKMWAPQVAALAGEYRVVAVDLPGHRALVDEPFSLETASRRVATPDGQLVVIASRDSRAVSRLWIAQLDRRSPPYQIASVEGIEPVFGPDNEVFFRSNKETENFAYRVRSDGTGIRKAIDEPIAAIQSFSPDLQWLAVSAPTTRGAGTKLATLLYPVAGGTPIRFSATDARLKWYPGGNVVAINIGRPTERGSSAVAGTTVLMELRSGKVLPDIPAKGFQSGEEIINSPGAQEVNSPDGAPGPSAAIYTFSRETIQRNLYRIPVP